VVQRYVQQYPQAKEQPEVKHRLQRLREEGKCGKPARAGRAPIERKR
jgi:hypothetical protein